MRLAAGASDEEVRTRASETALILARSHPEVVDRMVEWVNNQTRSRDERRNLVRWLGSSQDLRAVPALIEQLEVAFKIEGHEALIELTAHETAVPGDATTWREFWQTHGHLDREALLELGLERMRAAPSLEESARVEELLRQLGEKDQEIEALHVDRMGQDPAMLTAELANPYRRVRLEAAQRLLDFSPPDRARVAVPELVARLVGSEGDVVVEPESDPDVRAVVISALGKLGRDEDGTCDIILEELRSPHPQVAQAAVGALEFRQGQPRIVIPLLDFVQAVAPDAPVVVSALETVAANQPDRDTLRRLRPWMTADRPVPARAAAVKAVMATPDTEAALDLVEAAAVQDEAAEVRYNAARALGERLGSLEPDAAARGRIGALLELLLRDADPSVRAQAASSLGALGDPTALPLLARRSEIETDGSVLKKIVGALGQTGQVEGVAHIGRISGQNLNGHTADVLDEAQDAITNIGEGRSAEAWLQMARMLEEVAAYDLAAWTLDEIPRRFAAAPESRPVVDEARGVHAEVLFEAGRPEEAREELLALHEENAPWPSRSRRLYLLARANELMADHGAAADFDLELLGATPEGEVGRSAVQRNAIRTLVLAGRAEEAEPLLVSLLDEVGDDPAAFELLLEKARIHEQLQRVDAAIAVLEDLSTRVGSDDTPLRRGVDDMLARLRGEAPPVDGGAPGEPASGGADDEAGVIDSSRRIGR